MKRDRDNPEYVNEVWRRWQRRRNLPFRQFDAALADLRTELERPLIRLLAVLNRVFDR